MTFLFQNVGGTGVIKWFCLDCSSRGDDQRMKV